MVMMIIIFTASYIGDDVRIVYALGIYDAIFFGDGGTDKAILGVGFLIWEWKPHFLIACINLFWFSYFCSHSPSSGELPALSDLLRWGLVPDAFNRFAHRAELERPHPGISTALEKDFSGEERGFPSRGRISLNPKRVCGRDPEDWRWWWFFSTATKGLSFEFIWHIGAPYLHFMRNLIKHWRQNTQNLAKKTTKVKVRN